MTEVESLYLALCLTMFGVFAIGLAYSTWSWERSQSRVTAADRQPEQAEQPRRLAA